MSRSRANHRETRSYVPEFRIQAVKLVLEQGTSVSQAAEDLGVPLATLHSWIKKFKSGEWSLEGDNLKAVKVENAANSNLPKAGGLPQRLHDQLSSEQKKNAELERQLRRMTMERDVLKKAMAYCLDVPK